MTVVDHEQLRQAHPLNIYGRPSLTAWECMRLEREYGSGFELETLAVEDHRRHPRRAVISHQSSPHHPCPLCRVTAVVEEMRVIEGLACDQQIAAETACDLIARRAKAALGSHVDTPAEGSES